MKLQIKENSTNYTCTVVEIKDLFSVENADKIQRCVVFGNSVIVSKNIQVGDKMIYFVSGTKLNYDFCKLNNLFEKPELNEDKSQKGYLSEKCRVKAIKLRGIISDGMLMPISSLDVLGIKSNSLSVGDEFTDINDVSVCEKYVVPQNQSGIKKNNVGKYPKKESRVVDKQFVFHNDTSNLRRNMGKLELTDTISINYKKHGASAVVSNILVTKRLNFIQRLLKKIGIPIKDTEYDIIYSSRKVIKNQYTDNATKSDGFYGEDIWGVVAKEVGHLIPKGYSLYGEILGYTPNGKAIQKDYTYGCLPNQHKFYVYKISVVNEDGNIIFLTDNQIEEFCEKNGLLFKDTFLYYGTINSILNSKEFKDWFFTICGRDNKGVDMTTDGSWKEFLLEYLEYKYTEHDCYMHNTGVPEEGIVLRIESMYEYEAYKLKSHRFLLKESQEQDSGILNMEDNG